MAKAKTKAQPLSIEQLLEFLRIQGIFAVKVNGNLLKLPYTWGTEIVVPATEITILNAYHIPMKTKAKA